NANLSTILANLQLKRGCACIPAENMALLTDTARQVAEIANLRLAPEMPFVGRSAFAHKAGMHADGVLKNSRTFEHVPPDSVGNERRFLMSEITGRGAVLDRVLRFAPHLDKNHAALPAILDTLKQRELDGYQYEAADASFELLVRRRLEDHAPFFELIHYRITGEKPYEEGQSAIAYLKVRVGEQTQIAGGEGNGPVNALDKALRAALAPFFPVLENVFLVDYKVRVLGEQDATAAKVRVLITSSDGVRDWTTVGVSSDILEASWQALSDSIEYVLWTGEEGA
ncbi:MAG: citramalate synthase, partial [Oscillospiraceae bacterium]|nr:citramalate synthase [Oscillospiraceae bacterium]